MNLINSKRCFSKTPKKKCVALAADGQAFRSSMKAGLPKLPPKVTCRWGGSRWVFTKKTDMDVSLEQFSEISPHFLEISPIFWLHHFCCDQSVHFLFGTVMMSSRHILCTDRCSSDSKTSDSCRWEFGGLRDRNWKTEGVDTFFWQKYMCKDQNTRWWL